MPEPKRPAGGRGRPPLSTGGGQPRRPQPPRRTAPPQARPRPRPKNIIRPDQRPLPSSPPTLLYVIAALGLALFVWIGSQAVGGINFGSGSGGSNQQASDGKLPSVTIEGAIACEQNNSPRINLNTPERLQACKSAKIYTKQLLVQKHGDKEGERQFGCQDKLWDHESDWSAWAKNPSSGAYGLAQILPSSHGTPVEMGDWRGQVKWGMDYVWGRYKTSCNAWEFWQCTSSCARYPGGPVNKLGSRDDPQTTWY